jgi:hypothetical protein
MQGCTAQGAGKLVREAIAKRAAVGDDKAPLFMGFDGIWIGLRCGLSWAFLPALRKTVGAAGIIVSVIDMSRR